MRNPHGTPIWYEYHSLDADRAQAFYEQVFGWQVAPSGDVEGMDYRIVSTAAGEGLAGLMPRPDPSAPPGWLFYVGVDDVDAAIAAAQGSGGTLLMPAVDMEGVGRMALLADPSGQRFYAMRGAMDAPSRAFGTPPDAMPGQMVWNELAATDQEAALAFYAAPFGWRHEGAIPMGPLGDYRMVHAGDTCIGATLPVVPGGTPGWLFYVEVEDIDAAVARVASAGGTLLEQPTEIPGGSFSAVAADPDGARIGLVGPRPA
ncbi:putative enzyme related to lactoylglutathione lyase [Sphingomonas sp. BE138]|uniref:VOC family protein n=1 Tax=Sphingomonas sp. BE138 TaxID=2817845 RepID=UPI00286737DC|nr:VOC family protein [Sphingomonas sp. BE138]MDR6788582.1 putative enzyme related to lactoylglutathione lyase [Sphingomonas sp. BE138]